MKPTFAQYETLPVYLYTGWMYNEPGDQMYKISFHDLMTLEMAGRVSEAPGWNHTGRTLDRSILCYVEEGSCSFLIGNNRIELNPGNAVIIPQDVFYAPYTQNGCLYQYFHFHAQIEETDEPPAMSRSYRYTEQMEHAPAVFYLPASFPVDSSIRFCLEGILGEMTRIDPCSNIKMNLSFFEALTHAAERSVSPSDRTLACEIENYILENLTRQPTLSMLADHFGYTKQYLIRVFKKQFLTTPAAYINDAKLSRAVRYLTESDMHIDDIAHRCGFEDGNYFSRQFKKKYQLTPSDYRRQTKGI